MPTVRNAAKSTAAIILGTAVGMAGYVVISGLMPGFRGMGRWLLLSGAMVVCFCLASLVSLATLHIQRHRPFRWSVGTLIVIGCGAVAGSAWYWTLVWVVLACQKDADEKQAGLVSVACSAFIIAPLVAVVLHGLGVKGHDGRRRKS